MFTYTKNLTFHCFPSPDFVLFLLLFLLNMNFLWFFPSQWIATIIQDWNEWGFMPPLSTYRLNWARETSWGWWDEWNDAALQTQESGIRHRNSSLGDLRPSTLPLGRGGSPQYLTLRLMTPRSLGSRFHHLRTSCNLPAKVQAMSWVASDLWHLRSDSLPQEYLETSSTIMEIQVDILRGGGAGNSV